MTTDQSVMPSSSVQRIVAKATVQNIGQCVARNRIVTRTTDNVLNSQRDRQHAIRMHGLSGSHAQID